MKERLLTFALAIGALALFYMLFAPPPTSQKERVTRPVSSERGPNGYAALYRWLQAEKIPTISFRDRYNRLASTASGTGHLLITTMPHHLAARPSEITALDEWLRQGNTLLVLAALADTPDWAMDSLFERKLVDQVHDLTGLRFVAFAPVNADVSGTTAEDAPEVAPEAEPEPERVPKKAGAKSESPQDKRLRAQRFADAMAKLLEPMHHGMTPIGIHPLTTGVQAVTAISEYPASDWYAVPDEDSMVLELARDPTSKQRPREPVLWLAQVGSGQIIVSGYGSVFTNKVLGEQDNAQLLANIVRLSLQRSGDSVGTVVIDDAHQGLVAFYDPAAFFKDKRLHHTLWWLLLLWLVFVLGPLRLRPVTAQWNPLDITSFVRATGGFLARTVPPAEAGNRELKLFFNSIRRRLGQPEDGEPVWDWLATQAHVAPQDLKKLRDFHFRIVKRKRIDLPQLHNLLQRLTGSFV